MEARGRAAVAFSGGRVEALLARLIAAGHGIAGLQIERPGLHDAFVRIVGEEPRA